jgi:branched-subunit amino acid ABC-type transport system permease component
MLSLDAIVAGIAVGSIYGLIAIGYTVIFRATGVFNLAQGDLVMCATMFAWFLLTVWHIPQIGAFVMVLAGVPLLALFEERTVVRPFLSRGRNNIGWFISTLAFSLVLETLITKWYGDQPPLPIPSFLPTTSIHLGGVVITWQQIACIAALIIVVVALEIFYRRSWLGGAMRATAENRYLASMRGIPPNRMSQLAFLLGGGAAAVAGFISGPILSANPSIGLTYGIDGFIALALGGFGSIIGALVGALILGIGQQLFDLWVSPNYEFVAGLILFGAILVVRPRGLFGGPAARMA